MVSANWDAYLAVPQIGDYTFYVTFDNSVKFWLDEILRLASDEAGVVELEPIYLTRDRLYHMQIWFREVTGDARLQLEWACSDCSVPIRRSTVGSEYFYHTKRRLGNFPRPFLVWDAPLQPEAFYRDDPTWNTAVLRWIPPQDSGGKPVTGYSIYRNNGEPDAPVDLLLFSTDTGDVFNFTDTDLDATALYKYALVTRNALSESAPYEIVVQPSILPTQPVAPQLTGAETVGGTLVLQIIPPTGYTDTGRSDILYYELARNDGLGGVADVRMQGDIELNPLDNRRGLNALPKNVTLYGLILGRTYVFQVKYATQVGWSPFSLSVNALCCTFEPPNEPPLHLRRHPTLPQTDTAISLQWDAISPDGSGSTSLTAYRIFQDDGATEVSFDTASGKILDFQLKNLEPGRIYRYAVGAVNAAGSGPRSQRITLKSSNRPDPPTWYENDDAIVSQSPSVIHIKWRAPEYEGVAGVSGYKVLVDDGAGGAYRESGLRRVATSVCSRIRVRGGTGRTGWSYPRSAV